MKLVLIALLLPACLPGEESSNGLYGPRDVTVNYKVLGPGDEEADCPRNFETLRITAAEDEGYTGFTELIPCAPSGTHTYQLYTSGRLTIEEGTYVQAVSEYDISLAITDDTNELVRAEGLRRHIDISDGGVTVDLEIFLGGGRGVAEWEFTSGQTNSDSVSCAAMDVDEIDVTYALRDSGAPTTQTFPCNNDTPGYPDLGYGDIGEDIAGRGLTEVLAPGDYVATLAAKRSGSVVGTSEETFFMIDEDTITKTFSRTIEIADR